MSSPAPKLATWLRPGAVKAIRSMPEVRGRGRLAQAVNAAFLKAGCEPVTVVKMNAGHSLIVDSRIFFHCLALFTGNFGIDDLISALLRFVDADGVALDVGANVGFVTVPLALATRRLGARVVSVEPFSKNVEWLKRNLQLNQVEEQVTIVECGLSSEPGEAALVLGEEFETGAKIGNTTIAEFGLGGHFEQVAIQLNTLDAVWPTLGRPRLDAIKVDIEGHEDRFLEGAAETLRAYRPAILMEVNRWYYERRGVDFNLRIPPLLPPGYRFFTSQSAEVKSLADCNRSDVLLIPEEKVSRLAK